MKAHANQLWLGCIDIQLSFPLPGGERGLILSLLNVDTL